PQMDGASQRQPAFGGAPMTGSGIARMYQAQLDLVEADVVSLALAVPEEVFDFVPLQGEFEGARTFGEQVRHLATVLRLAAVVLTGGEPPFPPGAGDNGPDGLAGRDPTIGFLKAAFLAAREGIGTLTDQNHLDPVASVF